MRWDVSRAAAPLASATRWCSSGRPGERSSWPGCGRLGVRAPDAERDFRARGRLPAGGAITSLQRRDRHRDTRAALGLLEPMSATPSRLVASPFSPDSSDDSIRGGRTAQHCVDRINDDRGGYDPAAAAPPGPRRQRVRPRPAQRNRADSGRYPGRPVFLLRPLVSSGGGALRYSIQFPATRCSRSEAPGAGRRPGLIPGCQRRDQAGWRPSQVAAMRPLGPRQHPRELLLASRDFARDGLAGRRIIPDRHAALEKRPGPRRESIERNCSANCRTASRHDPSGAIAAHNPRGAWGLPDRASTASWYPRSASRWRPLDPPSWRIASVPRSCRAPPGPSGEQHVVVFPDALPLGV